MLKVALISLLVAVNTYASDDCYKSLSAFTETNQDSIYWSQKLMKKYGEKEGTAHLKPIFENPFKFKEQMQERFNRQKLITPDDPLQFDYMDMMEVELKTMSKNIVKEIEEVMSHRLKFKLKSHYFTNVEKGLRDFDTGIEYLNSLKKEIDQTLRRGTISYRRAIELSYYYSRATGYFDRLDISLKRKVLLKVEEHIQGYKKYSIQKEYELYKQRNFNWARRLSKFVSAFNWGTDIFTEAFENKETLEFILMPTHGHMGIDIFHRVMPSGVHLIGMTADPIGADGFFRPGGLFWMHDIRHSVLIHLRMLSYLKNNELKGELANKLIAKIDTWHREIDDASRLIEDKELRKVTRRLIFNIYHDRGYPIVPSSITKINHHYTMDALYHLLEQTGDGVKMELNSHKRVPEAFHWIKNFWESKHIEEEILLGSKPVAERMPKPENFGR